MIAHTGVQSRAGIVMERKTASPPLCHRWTTPLVVMAGQTGLTYRGARAANAMILLALIGIRSPWLQQRIFKRQMVEENIGE